MQATSFSEARSNLKKYFDEVFQNHEPLLITRKNDEHLVVLSLDDYNSLIETNHLISSKKNALRLLASLKNSRNGKLTKRELLS